MAFGGHAIAVAGVDLKGGIQRRVPCRAYSKPWRSARPGESGKIGSVRSSAWITVFSSTQNTAALG